MRRIIGSGIGVIAAALVAGAAHAPERPDAPDAAARVAVTGSIRGVVNLVGAVRYDGAPPEASPIDMSGDAYCTRANQADPAVARPIDVGTQGGLRGVVIHIRENVPAGPHPVPETSALLDQQGCMYVPGIVALRAGQTLVIRNSDETLHNVHVRAESNREFNIGQPIKGLESRRTFDAPEVGIRVTCDVHGWMGASVAVFDHPFFAVTDETGAFEIEGLPAGEYVVEAWHPTLGARTQRVSVSTTGAAQAAFTFEAM